MKYHLTGFGVSALLHTGILLAALPLLLWQDNQDKPAEKPSVVLSLAQFVPAPPRPEPVKPVPPAPKPEAIEKPKPKPEKQPVEKPKLKPEKKPVEKTKPKLEKKPVEKPKPKPEKKSEPKPQPRPQTAARPPVTQAPAQPPVPVVPRPAAPVAKPVPQATPAKPVQPESNPAAEAAYRRKLQSLIASRKKYPRQAERAEAEGSVVVAFTVLPNGSITGVRLAKSSGNNWLDQAAMQAVSAASGALPFPPEVRKTQWLFSLTVNFKLDW